MLRRTAVSAFAVRRTLPLLLSAQAVERSDAARQAILRTWKTSDADPAAAAATARSLMDEYRLTTEVARDEDIVASLGEAFDRLVLMLVPLHSSPANTEYLERALGVAARAGVELSIKTIQYLFARCGSYAEALTIFHMMRTSHVRMNMHAYYAMVFCLQRLEEESFATRFADELKASESKIPSSQAISFIMNGCDNQLLPESKPWVGRVMFADDESAPTMAKKTDDYDALGEAWVQRYKRGQVLQ